MITCKGCDKTWTGANFSHCSLCHETFSTEQNFDKHRNWRTGKCVLKPKGLMKSDRGVWRAKPNP